MFRKDITHIQTKFHVTSLVTCSHFVREKKLSYSQINTIPHLSKQEFCKMRCLVCLHTKQSKSENLKQFFCHRRYQESNTIVSLLGPVVQSILSLTSSSLTSSLRGQLVKCFTTRMVVHGQLVEPAVCLSDLYDVFLLDTVRDTRQNLWTMIYRSQ